MKNTFISIKIGSHLYNCNNEKSDTDTLHIFAQNSTLENSIIWSHHNYQYKNKNTDHIFTSLQNFIRNIIKGDSTINYECLFSDEIKHSSLSFLHDHRNDFNNYSLIKAYIGFIKRDLKFFQHDRSEKKLFHAYRGLWSVREILKNNYTNDIAGANEKAYALLLKIKNNQMSLSEMNCLCQEIETQNELLRNDLNQKLNAKAINKYISVNALKNIDEKIIQFCHSGEYRTHCHDFKIFNSLYDSVENEIVYSK